MSSERKRSLEKGLEEVVKVRTIYAELDKAAVDKLRSAATKLEAIDLDISAFRLKEIADTLRHLKIQATKDVSSQRRELTRFKKRRAAK